jgi:hypothetical protein
MTTEAATDSVVCATCGKAHARADTEIFFKRPDPFLEVPEAERGARTKVDDDLCMIDETRFFVRTILPIPVTDGGKDYCWGVWAEVEEPGFRRVLELWSAPEQLNEPVIEARLANEMPYYGGTYGLRVSLRLTGPTTRPSISLVDQHPVLSKHQSEGVARSEVLAFSHSRAGV